jgi:hypothetical protein
VAPVDAGVGPPVVDTDGVYERGGVEATWTGAGLETAFGAGLAAGGGFGFGIGAGSGLGCGSGGGAGSVSVRVVAETAPAAATE